MKQETIDQVLKFRDDRNWRQFHNPKDLAISISLEASELLEIFQWSAEDVRCEDKMDRIREELADVLNYCILMADACGLDLDEIIQAKVRKNAEKYPVDQAFGSKEKYTELKAAKRKEKETPVIRAVRGDITKINDVDAIVNAANTTLLGGGGVDGAIHRAAGPDLLKECRTLGGCETGKAKITGAYNLPCRYVIHTPGPIWRGGRQGERELLTSCYRSCLELAVENGIRKIAFPSISTGVYHFPVKEAADIAVQTARRFAAEHPGSLDLVEWVLFDDHTMQVYTDAV